MNTVNKTFDPQTIADDLLEVRHILSAGCLMQHFHTEQNSKNHKKHTYKKE